MKNRHTRFEKPQPLSEKRKGFQPKSIQSKIVLLLLVSVILSASVVGMVCIIKTSAILRVTAEDNMILICNRGAEGINIKLEKIEEQVTTMRHYAETAFNSTTLVGEGAEAEAARQHFIAEFQTVAKNHASSAEGIIGIFAIFDFNAMEISAPYGFSYLVAGHGAFTEQPLSELYGKPSFSSWYGQPVQKERALWLEKAPHPSGTYESAYVAPILLANGTCIGVVGVSCESTFLEKASHDFHGFESGFAFLLNSDNSVLYHPEINSMTGTLAPRPEFHVIEENERAEESDVSLYSYRHEGDSRYLSYTVLRNGKKLCISASQSEIYEWQSGLVLSCLTIVASVVALALLAAILFAKRLTQPIKTLNLAARDMLEGNLETELIPTTADEIGELTRILNRARERIKYQLSDLYNEAHHDGLTGVLNKTAFRDTERLMDRHIDYGNASFAVAILDVNRLKVTNDFFGHAAGDELLRAVANHLKAAFDPQSIFRIGGDEFALVLCGNDSAKDIAAVERCAAKIPTLHLTTYPDVSVSCAIGVTAYDKVLDNCFNDVLLRADRLMYSNKGESKRTVATIEGAKGIKQLQTEKFMEFLSILNQSTEDYLFLYEMESDKLHFFDDFFVKYTIPHSEDGTLSMATMTEALHPADRAAFTADITELSEGKRKDHHMNYRLTTTSGVTAWVDCRGRIIEADGHPFLLIGRLSDNVTRPWYNPVTGLFNRTRFLQDMQAKETPSFGSFMLLDIDNMSNLNLKLGRQAGDDILRLLAGTLESIFPHNRLYHMEKDRFAVLLDTTDEEAIRKSFETLLESLSGKLTASAAVVPNDEMLYADGNSIYEYSNQLLKENKSKKSGTIAFFTHEDFQKKISSIALIDELRHSIANNFDGFYVVYQPKIAADGYSVVGAEALLRYRSPSRGVISPAEFIPLLERTRLINKVGLFVCDTALRQCKLWREKIHDFHIAVNFSSIQLLEDETDELVLAMQTAYDLPGEALIIELTESIEVESTEVAEAFERFRAEGIRIAIDDFGTGYANLAYLKKIHADEIKIDRVFIKDIQESSYNYMVIKNILEFAKQNGFRVCLEGVETSEELSILEGLGADTLQGYLFDKPLSPEDFESRYVTGEAPEWAFMPELNLYKERAHLIRFNAKDILSTINIGLWVIRIEEAADSYKLFGDACMHKLLGVSETISPEECYRQWYDRIKPGHEDAVNAMVEAMAKGTEVCQAVYPWLHPTLGETLVRCTGKCVLNEDGVLVFEGFHRFVADAANVYTHLDRSDLNPMQS
ncbi:MAG: EAL domain-containing protein [Clostridia bacterium]|nr:EAL domain-containing protein [Clostridia bacterium]